jgi:uncharacterized protein (TIGR03086 family)
MSTQPLQATMQIGRDVLAAVTPDQLHNATPCESWDVSALINHMVGAQKFFTAGVTGDRPSGEEVDYASQDFLAAYDEATAECLASFQEDGALDRMLTLPFGQMPGRAFIGLVMTDTFQHAWDLAKATGQSTDLDPELAAAILAQSKQSIQESFRGPDGGAPFGVEQKCGEDASAADQLAAFLGRTI